MEHGKNPVYISSYMFNSVSVFCKTYAHTHIYENLPFLFHTASPDDEYYKLCENSRGLVSTIGFSHC